MTHDPNDEKNNLDNTSQSESDSDANDAPEIRRRSFNPKDTAILSRNNSGVRRFLNHQSDDRRLNTEDEDENTSSREREVLFVIRGVVERIVMSDGDVVKLGRFEIGTKRFDELDLTPYGALDRGVSRVHAQIFFENDKLYVSDLSSTNGTYIAGERLEPNTPRQIIKGDELMVGRLVMQILFR